ncbi:MAG: DUF1254 domain-containing protein [Solirubrobacterales bacterium]
MRASRRANGRLLRVLAPALALAAAVAGAAPASAASPDYTKGYDLGLEAWEYGLPLVKMDQTFRTQTSVNVPDGRGRGPVNRFSHVRVLADASARDVVAPNNDTPYSIAWLDLRRQPMVIHVPRVNRYFVIPLYDPYTEDFRNLGSVAKTRPGDYAVLGPGQGHLKLPKGVHRIHSRYDRVWIIGRTLNFGPADLRNTRRIQDRYRIVPLSRYGTGYRPKPPKHPDTTPNEAPMPTGLAFFDRLGGLLERFPPPAADRAELGKLAQIGVGPGKQPSADSSLSTEMRQGMIDAVAAGPGVLQTKVTQRYVQESPKHNGWLVLPTGRYGTDYEFRALVTQVGLGALTPAESIYPVAQTDRTLAALSGSNDYVVHFEPGRLPPVKAFWSLTLYDSSGFFVPNPIDRYAVGDRTELTANPDGSLDIYVQSTEPADPAQAKNWLPSPAGAPFRLTMRLYQPAAPQVPGIIDGTGWDPPTITRTGP